MIDMTLKLRGPYGGIMRVRGNSVTVDLYAKSEPDDYEVGLWLNRASALTLAAALKAAAGEIKFEK